MPFRSQAQRGFLFANHPAIAKRFAAETSKGIALPKYAGLTAKLNGPKIVAPSVPSLDEEKKMRY